MSSAKGIREVGHFDCAGGGQIEVQKGIAYVAHMSSPHGTSIVDVRDPKHPKLLSETVDARRHALAQGAGVERHHGGQP